MAFTPREEFVNPPLGTSGGAPSGTAGGDLAGTYPNPTVKADVGLTGNPTAPTQLSSDDSTRIASTAFVQSLFTALRNGVSSAFDTLAEIATELGLKAPLASPALTGTPTAPTASSGTNTTQVATTAFVQAAVGSGTPSSQEYTPDRRPTSANAADDEFDQADGTAVDTAGTRFSGSTAWTVHNGTGATIEQRRGALIITAPSDADAMDPRGAKQVLPAGDFEYECCVYFNPENLSTYAAVGIGLLENGTDKALHICMGLDSAGLLWQVRQMASATNWSANLYTSGALLTREHRIKNYFRVGRSGTNLFFKLSENGGHGFLTVVPSAAQTTYYTTAPDRVLLFANGRNGTSTTGVFTHFRRIA